jgi:hypothetical protein
MKTELIDLGFCVAKISSSHPVITRNGVNLDLFAPSSAEEGYGHEPSVHIRVYGRDELESLACAIFDYIDSHDIECKELYP